MRWRKKKKQIKSEGNGGKKSELRIKMNHNWGKNSRKWQNYVCEKHFINRSTIFLSLKMRNGHTKIHYLYTNTTGIIDLFHFIQYTNSTPQDASIHQENYYDLLFLFFGSLFFSVFIHFNTQTHIHYKYERNYIRLCVYVFIAFTLFIRC